MNTTGNGIAVQISSEEDIIVARQKVRDLALSIGFSNMDAVIIATAVSEITRNIITYAGKGDIVITQVMKNQKEGIEIISNDKGPGIKDLSLALQDGYSTGRGLGLGLPGTKRLMDEFDIVSEVSKGTKIIMRKWKT